VASRYSASAWRWIAGATLTCLPLACGGRASGPAQDSVGSDGAAGGAEAGDSHSPTGGTIGSGSASSDAGGSGGSSGGAPSGGATGAGGQGSGATGAEVEITALVDYFKSPASGEWDAYGETVALSADGHTLAVGSNHEGSAEDADMFGLGSGAVYVYSRQGEAWIEEAHLKPPVLGSSASFGVSVSLAASGDRLVVGANASGAAYVFSRTLGTWTQDTALGGSNSGSDYGFGSEVALSADGGTIAVSAPFAPGAGSEAVSGAGSVYVFILAGGVWEEQAHVQASNPGENDNFGTTVDLSGDGNMLIVGAPYERSAATGLDGDQTDDSLPGAGAAYLFERTGSKWAPRLYIKASNTGLEDHFGQGVACSTDGNTIAVGAYDEGSLTTTVEDPNQFGQGVGAVYVLIRSEVGWIQEAYLKASNPQVAAFGFGVALSDDGSTLLVGAPTESGASTGINGAQEMGDAYGSGAAYLFERRAAGWEQLAYIKANNTSAGAAFGHSVALDADAATAAFGARHESGSGAAYVYTFD
jgi:trimeric autotransporter adhesin